MNRSNFGGTPWLGLPSVGIYGTWQGIFAQGVVLTLLLLPSIVEKIRAARTSSATNSLPQPTRA